MSILLLAIVVAGFSVSAQADDRPLSGADILKVLTGNTVFEYQADGSQWRQYFDADGSTPYYGSSGPPSNGRWRISGDQYCSLWPPTSSWSCYDVTAREENGRTIITWIPASGETSVGLVVQGNRLDLLRAPE